MVSRRGRIDSINTYYRASLLAQDTPAGSLVLSVESGKDFVAPGVLQIGDQQFDYLSKEEVRYNSAEINETYESNSLLTLADPTTTPLLRGTRVRVYPPAEEKWAIVTLNEGQDEESILARIPHTLAALLESSGIRSENFREDVEVNTESVDGSVYVSNVFERKALLDNDTIDLEPAEPPTHSPGVLVSGVVGGISLSVNELLPSSNIYLYELSANAGFTDIVMNNETRSPSVLLAPVAIKTNYWARVTARNSKGAADPGPIIGPVQAVAVAVEDVVGVVDKIREIAPNVFRQTTKPSAATGQAPKAKDIWYDTDDKNKPYVHDGTDFRAVQDGTIKEAQDTADAATGVAADAAEKAANARRIFRADEMPWPEGSTDHEGDFGDIWKDSNNSNLEHEWTTDRKWTPYKIGAGATSFDVIAGKVVPIGTETKLMWGVADPITAPFYTAAPAEYTLPLWPNDGKVRVLSNIAFNSLRKFGNTFYTIIQDVDQKDAVTGVVDGNIRYYEMMSWQHGDTRMAFVGRMKGPEFGRLIGGGSGGSITQRVDDINLVNNEWWQYYTNRYVSGSQYYVQFRVWKYDFSSFRIVENSDLLTPTYEGTPWYPFLFSTATGVDGNVIIARNNTSTSSDNYTWAFMDTSTRQLTFKAGRTYTGPVDKLPANTPTGQLIRGNYGTGLEDALGGITGAGIPVFFNPTTQAFIKQEPEYGQSLTAAMCWFGNKLEWLSAGFSYVYTAVNSYVYKTDTTSRTSRVSIELAYSYADTDPGGDGTHESKVSPTYGSALLSIPAGMYLRVPSTMVNVGTDIDQPDSVFWYGRVFGAVATPLRRLKKLDGTFPSKVTFPALTSDVNLYDPVVPTDTPQPLAQSTFSLGTSGLLTSDKGGFRLYGDGTGVWPHLERRMKLEYDSRFALSGHNHDTRYAQLVHSHTEYAAKRVENQQHQGGNVQIDTNSSGQATVNFPVAYPAGSNVVVVVSSTSDVDVRVLNPTSATSFTVYGLFSNGSPIGATTLRIFWHAFNVAV